MSCCLSAGSRRRCHAHACSLPQNGNPEYGDMLGNLPLRGFKVSTVLSLALVKLRCVAFAELKGLRCCACRPAPGRVRALSCYVLVCTDMPTMISKTRRLANHSAAAAACCCCTQVVSASPPSSAGLDVLLPGQPHGHWQRPTTFP